jgi:hypothetical protein
MDSAQVYGNNDFNRAVELRETITDAHKVSFILIFKGEFFLTKVGEINTVMMNTPIDLISLSDKKYFIGLIEKQKFGV